MAYNETPTDWTAMLFKNHEVRVRITRTPQNDDADTTMEESIHIDPEQIEKIARKFVRHTAIAIAAVVVVIKVADTLGEIAVKKTKSKDDQ